LKYKEPLDHVIKIRCTSKEHERFLDVAQGSGLSVSDVLRRKLLGLKIPDKTHILTLYAVKNLERRVFEVGGLIKRIYGESPACLEDISPLLREQEAALREITRLLRELRADDH